MAESIYTTSAATKQPSLDIPWLRRWDREPGQDRPAAEDERQKRLVRIDYMTMLQELEFH